MTKIELKDENFIEKGSFGEVYKFKIENFELAVKLF